MKVALINPPLIGQKLDFMGHVPYQPIGLLYIASSLRAAGIEVQLLDAFGEAPEACQDFRERLSIRGLFGEKLIQRLDPDVDLVGISCLFGVQHSLVESIIRLVKAHTSAPVVVGGNHAHMAPARFLESGADYVVRGEGEILLPRLCSVLGEPDKIRSLPGIVGHGFDSGQPEFINDLDALPFPAYDLLRLESYWNFGDAHGPMIGPYFDLITSRGCPYDCDFCASPALSQRRWRSRSAENVVLEMEKFHRCFGVVDFHIQDANYTCNRQRARSISELILARGLDIGFSLPSGIKGETIATEDVDLMAASGLHYLGMAPETGSPRVLGLMNKKVDYDQVRLLTRRCVDLGVHSAGSFIIGFPGEDDRDREMTLQFVLELARMGMDEVAIFIMIPLPGARAEALLPCNDYDLLCVTPTWRNDFPQLSRWRRKIILAFLLTKLRHHPRKIIHNVINTLLGRGEIKGEMVVRRAVGLWRNKLLGARGGTS